MNEPPEDDAKETPIKRALRMKNAAFEAKPKAPGAGFNRDQTARMRAGASKPWMKR